MLANMQRNEHAVSFIHEGAAAAQRRWEECDRDLDRFTADLLPGVPRPLQGAELDAWVAAFGPGPRPGDPGFEDYFSGLGMAATDIIDHALPD